MDTPLVTVIVPTYNRVDHLEKALYSIVNQTYRTIEIIVVDDGSPNDYAAQLCKNFKNVDYFKIVNSGGPAKPRNVGIKKASGDYIAFLDDDDIWVPNKIEDQVQILEKNRDFGLVHSYCNIIDEKGNLVNKFIGKPGSNDVKHGDVKLKMMGNWTLMMPTPLLRRKLIEKVGDFNLNIPAALEDVEFWTRCSFHTKFYYLDKPLANYRVHDNNISADNKNYSNLPVYLHEVLLEKKRQGLVTNIEYQKLLSNLYFSQAKHIKKYPFQTIFNLFKLNPFWIVNFRILKVIVKRLTT